jgi:hypothetical protein
MDVAATEFNDMLLDNASFLRPFAVNLTKVGPLMIFTGNPV